MARLSQLTGQSKSSFIAEVLESSMPVLERMVTVLDAAKQVKDSLKETTKKSMEASEAMLHDVLGITMDIFDQSAKPILEEAERIQRRATQRQAEGMRESAPNGLPAAERPPLVTRGSGTPNKAREAKADKPKQGAGRSLDTPQKPLKRPVAAKRAKVGG